MWSNRLLIISLCVFLSVVGCAASSQNHSTESSGETSFGYKFENPRFIHLPLIEIDLDAKGKGKVRFKRNESDEIIDLDFQLLPATVTRIRQLFDETGFLGSSEEYQGKKDFSHLGWVTLSAQQGDRQRAARFNHTTHPQIEQLAAIFRAIATQQIQLFDIDNAQQYQPLDLARQLDVLENELRLDHIAEPEALLPALREIASSDTAILIARNKASRMIADIEKKKYKSPMRKQ
jgi:hypothetical protein